MKGIRFYQEFENKSKTRATGNVVAIFAGKVAGQAGDGRFLMDTPGRGRVALYEGLGSVYSEPNSPVASTSVAVDHLNGYCKRVPEAKARKIHPALFEYLDKAGVGDAN